MPEPVTSPELSPTLIILICACFGVMAVGGLGLLAESWWRKRQANLAALALSRPPRTRRVATPLGERPVIILDEDSPDDVPTEHDTNPPRMR